MCPSTGASRVPAQVWIPRPYAMCSRTFLRSIRNSLAFPNFHGSRLAAPRHGMSMVSAGSAGQRETFSPARILSKRHEEARPPNRPSTPSIIVRPAGQPRISGRA
jgi:hypothetical protein